MTGKTYEDGYRHGESNVQADWEFALDEYCTLPDDVKPSPTQVAKYIARLQQTQQRPKWDHPDPTG